MLLLRPTAIPSPEQLGVREGAGYAGIAGWMETKLGSYRVQDQADVVQAPVACATGRITQGVASAEDVSPVVARSPTSEAVPQQLGDDRFSGAFTSWPAAPKR